jgi:phosphoribosylanthranilate isomerase
MTFSIKICGLKTSEAVELAVRRGATHIGFIFFPKSPRYVEPMDAARLAEAARGKARIVSVTVDADTDFLDEIVDELKPDILQLHGHESIDEVLRLKAFYARPVMKAFSIRDAHDLDRIDPYIGAADRFLLDAKAPAGSELPGGNGVSFDWSLLDALDAGVDYMLSGGLNKDNVAEAILGTRCSGIDVSSGVESAPGEKDLKKMNEFFDAAERAIAMRNGQGSLM